VKAGWINIDIDERADLQLDLRANLPFPDNSVSFIYSEHFFEHLEYPRDTSTFLKESLRVLIPKGSRSKPSLWGNHDAALYVGARHPTS
jgi:predicted SAM-dependent methyltransferase